MRADRRLILPLFAVVALGLYFLFAPRLPKDQTVEVVLGDAASKVTSVRLAYEDPNHDWASEVEFNFASTPAPRVVHHETHMPNGDYKLSIDVTGHNGNTHVERTVSLGGGTTSVDVASVVLAALDAPGASR